MPYLHHHGFWITNVFDDFTNNDFIDTNVTVIPPDIVEITGWTFYLRQTKLNGLDSIAGFPTPIDQTRPRSESTDNVSKRFATDQWKFLYEFSSTILPPGVDPPAKSVRIYSSGAWINSPYGILRGPYMVSKKEVRINAGSRVSFWYRGLGSGDAFDIFGYLLNVDNGNTVTLVNLSGTNASGATDWIEVVQTVETSGSYKFVFINGSWDFTGGQLTGASMYVSRVRVIK